jgi:hypothetical protein
MEHKRSTAMPVAIAVLLLLPVLYVGSYLVLKVESQLAFGSVDRCFFRTVFGLYWSF